MSYSQMDAESALDTEVQNKVKIDKLVFANIPYTPSVMEENYVRVAHRPGSKKQVTLGTNGLNRISGEMFLYVSYSVTNSQVGTYEVHLASERLVASFERGKVFSYNGVNVVCSKAQRTGSLESEDRFTDVVIVSWYAHVSKDTVILA